MPSYELDLVYYSQIYYYIGKSKPSIPNIICSLLHMPFIDYLCPSLK